jgi:hypothetical protein
MRKRLISLNPYGKPVVLRTLSISDTMSQLRSKSCTAATDYLRFLLTVIQCHTAQTPEEYE